MRGACMLLAAAACLPAAATGAADMPPGSDIPAVVVDGGSITVSGLSSGAFQAVQMHYAFSLTIKGAGVLAGGPFWCAQDDVLVATSSCMTSPGDIDVEYLAGIAENTALWGFIDPLSGLKDSRVWLFSGINDSVVNQGVVKAAASMYAQVLGDAEFQMSLTTNLPGEHAQQTLHYGNTCEYLGEPFINMCGVDAAGDMLQWLYPGQLSPPETNVSAAMSRAAFGLPAGGDATQELADATVLCALDAAAMPMGRGTWQVAPLPECPAGIKAHVASHATAAAEATSVAGHTGAALKVAPTPVLRAGNGTLYTFDQGLFVGGGGWSTDVGLAQMAFVFIPDACLASNSGAAPASGCILHMAFHGCEQTVDDIGHTFMTGSNYLPWASKNNIVVAFPQAVSNALNPKGCHDWWGYTGTAYASNWGTQPLTMKRVLDSLQGNALTPNRTELLGSEEVALQHWRNAKMGLKR